MLLADRARTAYVRQVGPPDDPATAGRLLLHAAATRLFALSTASAEYRRTPTGAEYGDLMAMLAASASLFGIDAGAALDLALSAGDFIKR